MLISRLLVRLWVVLACLGLVWLLPAHAASDGTFSGKRTTPLVISKPGTYTFGPGAEIDIDAQRTRQQVIACKITASNVTVEGLTVIGGWRGYSFQQVNHVVFRHCRALYCGKPQFPGGGSCFLGNDGQDVTLEDCEGGGAKGEHALYIGQTYKTVRIRRSVFWGEHGPVVQFNSESGSGITDVQVEDTKIRCTSTNQGPIDCLGLARSDNPAILKNDEITGGNTALIISNYAAGRPSYVRLVGGSVTGPVAVRVEGGSRGWKTGGVKIQGAVKQQGGGLLL